MRYHIESTREMDHEYVGCEKLSGCRIDNGNYTNTYNVPDEVISEFLKYLSDDENVVKFRTS